MGADLDQDEAKVLKFVDDSKAFQAVSNEDDVEKLQISLDKLYKWQVNNNVAFNSSKFQLLRIGPNKELKQDTLLFTNDMKEALAPADNVRDLGIQMDSEVNFNVQRSLAINKTKRKMNWVLRTFRSREPYVMLTLWKTLIRPHLDYCSQLWAPSNLPGPLKEQEEPLRCFTKRIKGCWQMSYWERLRHLNLNSTQRRVERYRAIYMWKVHMGLVPNFGVDFISSNSRLGTYVSLPPYKGTYLRYKTLKENSMAVEGAKIFNGLPMDLRNYIGPKDKFKSYLDKYLTNIPDTPNGYGELTPWPVDEYSRPSNKIRDWTRLLKFKTGNCQQGP